jgi:two-component system KDP operon response regulator KdpE
LVLLDVMMPDMNGFETLQHIRETSSVPVIMLTVQSEEEDIVRGLALGADDYVTKPFSPRELTSRIKALLRRAEMPAPMEKDVIEIDDRLSIDFQTHEVWVEGKQIRLRPTEYRLLYHLVNNAGWVMSRETLLSKVWGPEYRDEIQYLRLYVNYLRQKIEVDPAHPNYILTERGVGYRFVDFRHGEAKE